MWLEIRFLTHVYEKNRLEGGESTLCAQGPRKIAWVSWGKVCKPKSDGGLGVRDLRAVNLKLLGKWRWRLISGGDPEDAISDWFSEGVSKKVVSTQSTSTVREMGRWVEGQWLWDLRWRRDLFVWEPNLLESLNEIMDRSTISTTNDSWCWKHDPSGCYSVKPNFLALSRSTTDEVIFSVEEHRLLPKVWKTWAPSKVAVFYWQLLQDRLPTRQNLCHWGVIGDASASMCVLCGLGPESADHLFGSCNQISPIWYSILRWLSVELVPSLGVVEVFDAFLGMGVGRKDRLGWCLRGKVSNRWLLI
ncbi:hypothetical protein TSUD_161050 [Trifolium subterraneum]|uniref:Reverse transcriptase zinc-binding domain-containing protein n=1 Tax=Trifolium subterraneum TaxID=3900 RepID=A0A2Z6NE77_TRISU|nr:hypothetical protein TSUD_161050 [Trifolium subterraneum]